MPLDLDLNVIGPNALDSKIQSNHHSKICFLFNDLVSMPHYLPGDGVERTHKSHVVAMVR